MNYLYMLTFLLLNYVDNLKYRVNKIYMYSLSVIDMNFECVTQRVVQMCMCIVIQTVSEEIMHG